MAYKDDELRDVVALVQQYGSAAEAARAIGKSKRTVQHQYAKARERNFDGQFLGGPLPDGRRIGKVTVHRRREENGAVIQEWQRTYPVEQSAKDYMAELGELLSSHVTPIEPSSPPAFTMADLLTLYPIPDLHLGMYAWGKEVGNKYDLDIAQENFKRVTDGLLSFAPATETAVILNLGDYFHAPDNTAMTQRSKNRLDVDGRWQKVLSIGGELMMEFIDKALRQHDRVVFRSLNGNHDPLGGDILAWGMNLRYTNEPRVFVDRSPATHWFYEHGKVMLAAHHGHETPPQMMPSVMASFEPAMWGRTVYRYAYLGHKHAPVSGPRMKRENGATWEILEALTAQDAYARGLGHAAGRGMSALVYSKADGMIMRLHQPL